MSMKMASRAILCRTDSKSHASLAMSHGNPMRMTAAMMKKTISALMGVLIASSAFGANLVPLDVATVTTGGTAVVALTQNHRSGGGWIQNPPSATVNLCINEVGTATGTTSSGNTTCIVPGQSYVLIPNAGPVSVISSDSSHPFSGYGIQQ